ncbi:MAG: MvdC/MvdD family ATP grasp protein [Candidatus Falkowbacteria bacterium]
MKTNILVISNKFDVHTDSVVFHLNEMGESVIRINTEDFRKNSINWRSCNDWSIATHENRTVNPSKIKSVYVRRMAPINTDDIQSDYKEFVKDESQVMLDALPFLLSEVLFIDDPLIRGRSSNKIVQLVMAEQSGLLIPNTLITNQFDQVEKFCAQQKTIYKTLNVPIIDFKKNGLGMINTTVIYENDLQSIKNSIDVAPCIFQEYVEKCFELRIHIIGKKIFSVKIDSQNYKGAEVDWRCGDFDKLHYENYELPNGIKEKILELMESLLLNFGIIDMIVTPDGDNVFLEINPNGNWIWIEQKIKIPISKTIANCQSLKILNHYSANYLGKFLIKFNVNFFGDFNLILV